MPEGVIVGGWSFVIAAYIVTVVGLAGYGLSLRRRLQQAEDDEVER